MPNLPQRSCSVPACRQFKPCPDHHRQRQRESDARRGTFRERGYSSAWDKASKAFRAEHPLCADPFGVHGDRPVLSEEVHHVVAHRGDQDLFWNAAHWMAICKSCHSRLTMEGK
jgi:5-methylcytosine-specific restriction protein A